MFICGRCRIENVAESQRCSTIDAVRAHYVRASVSSAPKAPKGRKAQPKR